MTNTWRCSEKEQLVLAYLKLLRAYERELAQGPDPKRCRQLYSAIDEAATLAAKYKGQLLRTSESRHKLMLKLEGCQRGSKAWERTIKILTKQKSWNMDLRRHYLRPFEKYNLEQYQYMNEKGRASDDF